MQFIEHGVNRKARADKLAPLRSQLLPQGGVARQLEQPPGQGFAVARRNEEPGLVVNTNFSRSVAIISHRRTRRGHRLGQRARQPFPARQMNQNIHYADIARHVSRSDQAGKDKVFLQAGGPGAIFQPFAPRPIAHE